MESFFYFQPTEIHFGAGMVKELGTLASRFGRRCLLVSTPVSPAQKSTYDRAGQILSEAGLEVVHFDGVHPNPTTEDISQGTQMAKDHNADVIIGLGGGSSMDSAKAIAVEATHDGTAWDYLFFRETQPSDKTLPVIAVPTTSGTGSHVTQVAVVTNLSERNKSALYHKNIFPKACIVDPELMVSLPQHLTASTGFDVFCHAFESLLHPNASPLTEPMALDAIRLVATHLPTALRDPKDLAARTDMAKADSQAGLCIANAGVTLPHGVGMAISGLYPHVKHGESLATIYPAFTRFTCSSAVKPFAKVARIFAPEMSNLTDEEAAEAACEILDSFIERIGMSITLKDMDMPEGEISKLAEASMVLPDYKGNPRVASPEEMLELIRKAYTGRP